MPRAYVIGQFDLHDPDAYSAYRAQTPATIEKYGGRFLVRAGHLETLEGDPPLPRIVVLEFPSLVQAKAWYDSEEYQALIPIRQAAAVGHSFLVEGADET